MCVSNLLEYLLEGDELLTKLSNDDGSKILPSAKPSKPHRRDLTNMPPETTAANVAARSDPEVEEAAEAVTVANLQEGEQPQAPPCSPAASAVPSTPRKSTCPSLHRAPAVIFVGFGTGAHALLRLASGPLRALSQPPHGLSSSDRGGGTGGGGGGEGEGDGGRDFPNDGLDGGDGNEREQQSGRGNHGGGAETIYCGRLASVLHNKGLRVGGMILANGFVSLDEQSTQVGERRGEIVIIRYMNLECGRSDLR